MPDRRRFALLKQPFALDALGDVTISSPVTGQVIQYNGTVWANTTLSITASQVSDFSEAVDDRVAALLSIGNGLTATYNDAGNTYSLSANIDGTSLAFATGVIQRAALTGDVTASAGSNTTSIAANAVVTAKINDKAVTYAKIQDVTATSRFLGRITAAAGVMEELTGTQATTLLDAFTSTLKGLVPASGGGTTNFLRADGSWAAPSGGGSGGSTYAVYANADQTKTSDTTLADDATLVATLTASKKYRIEIDVYMDSSATPGMKYDFNFTGTTTSFFSSAFHGVWTTSSLAAGTSTSTFALNGCSALNVVRTFTYASAQTVGLKITVGIEVGASGGVFSFRWAQATSSATATTRRRNSTMLVTEVA